MNNEIFISGAVSEQPDLDQRVGFVPSNQTSFSPGGSVPESQGAPGLHTAKPCPNSGDSTSAMAASPMQTLQRVELT